MNTAQVVECYGRRVILALPDGTHQAAEVFGKRLRVVCGDQVRVESNPATQALQIMEVLPRNSHFTRTDSRGQPEVLAANITQLMVLMSDQPRSDPYIVDRYLAGAELGNLKALILITKHELGLSDELQSYQHDFEQAGYPVLCVSAVTGEGLTALRAALKNEVSMLVGESGVGKSTLTNALLENNNQATREISDTTGEGRHTTVSSAMFKLREGGALMDSPGVRDYAPAPVNDLQVAFGWREFTPLAGRCKFNNCLHLREPGCAVLAAVEQGSISTRRYESYKRLLNLMRQLLPSYERR
jgi:ribosome biogenesis GTPase / thiamine phosphate phosphatase